MNSTVTKTVAAPAAGIAVVAGAAAISSGDSSPAATGQAVAAQGSQGTLPQQGAAPQQGTLPPTDDGNGPDLRDGDGPPGFGTPATGAAAEKAAAAATKAHGGTVERVMQLRDGSYEVHVITSSGERHVLVSKAFEVTGTEQRQGPPPGMGVPQGTVPRASAADGLQAS